MVVETRQVLWNIDASWIMYLLFAVALVMCIRGFYLHAKTWQQGVSREGHKSLSHSLKDVVNYAVLHKRLLEDRYAGVMHLCIFAGFTALVVATAVVFVQDHFGLPLFVGFGYIFIKVLANVLGLAAFVGVIMAFVRRGRKAAAGQKSEAEDWCLLVLLGVMLLTGFVLEGMRISATDDPWAVYGLVGNVFVPLFNLVPPGALEIAHRTLWWFHCTLCMLFIALLPYTKLAHTVLAPVGIALRDEGPVGVAQPIDFEDESVESYGTQSVADLDQQTLFYGDACVRCGRCQDNCPAFASGKGLNPLKVLQDVRRAADASRDGSDGTLVGAVVSEEDLWACTTCRACEANCPVFVSHVDKIVGMRRHLVLMEGACAPEAQQAFRGLETNGNPWGLFRGSRFDHLASLDVPSMEDMPEAEVLLWPGCTGSYDERGRRITTAVVALLRAAGVRFAAAGNTVTCCGDSARRMGNEYLYETLVRENVEALNNAGVKRIVTSCPHCLHTLLSEYPSFGGDYEVVHHTTFLAELLKSGRLILQPFDHQSTQATQATQATQDIQIMKGVRGVVSFHDPCYLGRYHGVYDDPRVLLEEGASLRVTEAPHSRSHSFCCGAGGGRMWLEEEKDKRVNHVRTTELLDTDAECIVTACPFCTTMLGDGVTDCLGSEADVKVKDVSELLAECLPERCVSDLA